MASADIWAGLASGLNTLGSTMQQRQQQAWQEKLKEQERANELARQKALIDYRAETERKARVGQVIGDPTATPDGQFMAWQYGEDGTPTRNVLGQMSEAEIAEMQRQRNLQEQLDQFKAEYEAGRLTKQQADTRAADARAAASNATASYRNAQERDLTSGGTGRSDGSRSGSSSGGGGNPKTSDIKNAEEIAKTRALRELGLNDAPDPGNTEAYQRFVRSVQKHYDNVMDESGSRGKPGSSQSNPLTINPGDPEPDTPMWVRVPDPNSPSGWRVVYHKPR